MSSNRGDLSLCYFLEVSLFCSGGSDNIIRFFKFVRRRTTVA